MPAIWLRLEPTQSSIQPIENSLFFGTAFLSFMAVAYVPSFLEDRFQYEKEYRNGLYGAGAFITSNVLIGIPYLLIFSFTFAAPVYWLTNLRPTTSAFFTFVLWIFFNLLASESQVVLAAALFSNFVVTIAVFSLISGLWMCVSGFMVPLTALNVFYKYVFFHWNFQKYVFESLLVNELSEREYSCGSGCQCMYISPSASQCRVTGKAVLAQQGFPTEQNAKSIGIIVAIIVGYRLVAYAVLKASK
ncbi:hypothetical protein HIM_04634 [Hirsutella minnesotensis 3608]|uniref:ABC-2 type transporter transmembrane domain-containing protein n=1 Tax=Hirsutella minnesotensis 3608 TaxID=1043627 RepID=A0A0F7ZPN5_9HYPO|nr:hypothetical protein HIM_04634 [Hirsutella minnesotensis 3608]